MINRNLYRIFSYHYHLKAMKHVALIKQHMMHIFMSNNSMQHILFHKSQTSCIMVMLLTRAVLSVLLVLRVEVVNGISHYVFGVHCFL